MAGNECEVKVMSEVEYKEGFYHLYNPSEEGPVLVHGYHCTDMGGEFVFGFNTHDGGNLVPLSDLGKDSRVVPVAVSEQNMPQYQCYKRVWAHKIKEIAECPFGGGATITPDDSTYQPFKVSYAYLKRNKVMHAGGYYVRYEDGYESYSPEEPFEAGYALIAD